MGLVPGFNWKGRRKALISVKGGDSFGAVCFLSCSGFLLFAAGSGGRLRMERDTYVERWGWGVGLELLSLAVEEM